MGFGVTRRGDDLFYNNGKLSISIASTSPVSCKIHFGVNVRCDGYMSLEKMGIKDAAAVQKKIGEGYAAEFEDMERDIRKSRPLEAYQ